jgi:hypothetical protein
MELAHRRRTGLGSSGESSQQIVSTLRKEGYTHLLLCPPDKGADLEFDATLSRLLALWLAERPPLYHEALADPDGVVRRYSIYALGDGDPVAKMAGKESQRR